MPSPLQLVKQLRELEEDAFITRTVYPVVPPKVEQRCLPESLRAQYDTFYTYYLKG